MDMELIEMLIDWFGLNAEFTNFAEFLPWFCKLLLAVFMVCFVIKTMFEATWKIQKSLR